MLAAGPDSATTQHTERGKALGENLGDQCGWKLLTDWASGGQAKASSVGAALNGETHAAKIAKEKLQAAAEAAAIKGGKGQQIRAPLFRSALREVAAEDAINSALVLPKAALNAQCIEGNLGLFLRTELVRDRGSGKAGAYTESEVWSAIGDAAPVLEVLGSRLLANGLTNWERAADGGEHENGSFLALLSPRLLV